MSDKIKSHHVERKAILYVRQSSVYQVQNNSTTNLEELPGTVPANVDSDFRPWPPACFSDAQTCAHTGEERVARRLAKLDRKSLDGIAELDPATQGAVAIWAARRACAVAGLTDLGWVKPTFAAFERGESLPFDLGAASGLLRADPHVRLTTVTSPDGGSQNVPQTWP